MKNERKGLDKRNGEAYKVGFSNRLQKPVSF
jgi:hypothetical protein